MTRSARSEAALIGALTADAAAMGLHWLYDPDRIAALAQTGPLLFRVPDPADFDGFKGVFVHQGRASGNLSQYGAQLRTSLQALADKGGAFDMAAAQARFVAAFAEDGWWTGYRDKPTKGALENIAAGRTDPSGILDDQLPALPRLIPLLARPGGADAGALAACMSVTNLGEDTLDHARAFAAALEAALDGADIAAALAAGEAVASAPLAAALRDARASAQTPVDLAGRVGRHCHLPAALPVIWRIAAEAPDFATAAEWNVRAGGDSCGRAIALGALMGAVHGVPPLWIQRLTDGPALAAEIAAIA
jgi:hypothetical protein